ncbi:plasma-membrane calcium-translocating P-type ATPase [Butyrivibrio fibrisolvens]|uniref:P-type Ca(2+) transporter n=1 Tax=Butyrivibrio fibrisolvens TaxID=831 RepID=A0A1H9RQK4_BUTFI|nr:calcium-translocating P-type ATPase, PMCA-type [Butyrivibrio fibrisolvens]SER74838.1 plasma-membrane calcium-translocating P-type ATPase [Butyrivibrio fibrisolvens]
MSNKGLTDKEVQESREKYGSNIIPDSEPTTFWEEFKETFSDPMIKILLFIVVIMLVMFFLGHAEIYEPIGTIVAVLIVAFVTAKTGVASDTKYRELKQSSKKDTCKVYRNGIISVIEIDDVVVGDRVILQSGDKIPADGLLVEGDLRVDNSVLNGEAEECSKCATSENAEFPKEITGDVFVDDHSLFRGAVIFDGDGVMDVRKVGLETMMGKMAEDMQDEEPDSPLKVKLGILANQISVFGYVAAVVIVFFYMAYFIFSAGGFGAYFAAGWSNILMNVIEAVSLAILIVVCAVPEGLPLMISLVLMQNTSKMLDHNVLVRKAVGIETAGSLNILFSDKTGTITKGSLEVVDFFTADGANIPLSEIKKHVKVKSLVDIAIGKNTASMFDGEHRIIGGNATDQALLRFLGEEEFNFLSKGSDKNTDYSIGMSQGFNSSNKFSQVEIRELSQVFYKGAPERLLASAKKCLDTNGNVVELLPEAVEKKINEYASRAMRVLAFGYSDSKFTEDKINDDVVIIGFVAIRDDVRPEAKQAIKEVQDAGIQVVMITGDRLETAVSIAKDAGLIKKDTDIALTSSQLSNMTDDELKSIVKDIRVIARALPTDKSRMVRICQEMNLVCGMTGDGVNDAPALKRADVGFAMGSGTEAAKEAGEIVIIDDNFRSIKDAILYGRTIYHNILKFCKFQLVINVAAVLVSAISPFFGIVEPLKVTHLLFVNLVMDSLGAIMLGNEPALEKYMSEPPRRRDESIISKDMAAQILTMALWLTGVSFAFLKMPFFADFYKTQNQLYTAYFVLFVVAALFNGFNVRDDGFDIFKGLKENPGFNKVWLAIVLAQALIVNAALIPLVAFKWVSSMFSCTPFGLGGWAMVLILAATMVPVDMIRKYLIAIFNKKNAVKVEVKSFDQVEKCY